MTVLEKIPTNIITGFLGAGKSTAILHLLQHKPPGERWAVLVNEFGEVGIDGRILSGGIPDPTLFIREVAGGCMCCAAGLPMQIALNRLLHLARPQRLLIEPTGLGHPAEILSVLRSGTYAAALDVRAVLALVDARKIADERYLQNAMFNQQLAIADAIIANKVDLYGADTLTGLQNYLDRKTLAAPVYPVLHGRLDPAWLDSAGHAPLIEPNARGAPLLAVELPSASPTEGFTRQENRADGYYSCGWIFNADYTFDYARLLELLWAGQAERIKGVFITDTGVFALNKSAETLTEMALDDAGDSRLEIIDAAPPDWRWWQDRLLEACRSE